VHFLSLHYEAYLSWYRIYSWSDHYLHSSLDALSCDSLSFHPLALFNTVYCFSLHCEACLSWSRIYSFSVQPSTIFVRRLITFFVIVTRFLHWHCTTQCITLHWFAKIMYLDLESMYSWSDHYLWAFAWRDTSFAIVSRFLHWHWLTQFVAFHCITKLIYLDLGSIHSANAIFRHSSHSSLDCLLCDSHSLHFSDTAMHSVFASHCIAKLIYTDPRYNHSAITFFIIRRLTCVLYDSLSLPSLALFSTVHYFSLLCEAYLSWYKIYSLSDLYLHSSLDVLPLR